MTTPENQDPSHQDTVTNETTNEASAKRELRFDSSWSYAPAPESTDHIRLESSYGLFIDGEVVGEPQTNEHFATINPAREEKLADVALAGAADVDRAVLAARRALEGPWGRMSGAERGKILFRIARMIQERARELAIIESLDGGKPIRESRDIDLPLVAAHFFYYAGWADKLEYAFPGRRVRPLGVAAQVIPWNFPLLMAAWKLAPALATGNTVVLKPAETHSADRAQARGDHPGRWRPARSRQHRHGRR